MTDKKPGKEKKQRRRGRGEGTVYPRKDGRWGADITLEDGTRKTLYGKTQEEAIAKLKQAEYEKRQGILATGPKQKVADHLNWWFEEVKRHKIRESTYKRYRGLLKNHILPSLGHIQLQKLTLRTIQSFYNKKLKENQSPSSVRSMHKVLHGALELAVKERLISFNPSTGASLLPEGKRDPQPLTLEQAQHLIITARGSELEVIVALALTSGIRQGEIAALRWEDINFEGGSIFIHRTVDYILNKYIENSPKTEAGMRHIAIPSALCDLLKQHQIHQKAVRLKAGDKWQNRGLVFCNRYGGYCSSNTLRVKFYQLLEKAGLPRMDFHTLRHCASTLFQSMGVRTKVVQQILGHSHEDITANVYTWAFPSEHKEAAEKMNNLFLKPF